MSASDKRNGNLVKDRQRAKTCNGALGGTRNQRAGKKTTKGLVTALKSRGARHQFASKGKGRPIDAQKRKIDLKNNKDE